MATSDATPFTVLVTGAAGNIAYNLIFSIASGMMFGPDRRVVLHLLDIPPMADKVAAVAMELEDLASPLLHRTVATTDVETAFTGVQYALLVGARPRGPGMERKDLLAANASIFEGQGKALDAFADRDVKVCVVGNPANTNALIAMTHAPSIPRTNFTALTRLDQNRAKSQLATRIGRRVGSIKNVVVWGNHSSTQYPDARFATAGSDGVPALVADDAWLRSDFITTVQTRGAAVIKARGASSAASAAAAICDHMRDWVLGSKGEIVSMGVCSDGNPYGVAEDLIFSMPVICEAGGRYTVQTLAVDAFSSGKLKETEAELAAEKALALP